MKIDTINTHNIDYDQQYNLFNETIKGNVNHYKNDLLQSQNGIFTTAAKRISAAISQNKTTPEDTEAYPLITVDEQRTTSNTTSFISLASSLRETEASSSSETLPGMKDSHFSLSNTLVNTPSPSESIAEKMQDYFPDTSTYTYRNIKKGDGTINSIVSYSPSEKSRAQAIKEKGEDNFRQLMETYIEQKNLSLLNPMRNNEEKKRL